MEGRGGGRERGGGGVEGWTSTLFFVSYRHSPFRVQNAKNKEEIDKLTLEKVNTCSAVMEWVIDCLKFLSLVI